MEENNEFQAKDKKKKQSEREAHKNQYRQMLLMAMSVLFTVGMAVTAIFYQEQAHQNELLAKTRESLVQEAQTANAKLESLYLAANSEIALKEGDNSLAIALAFESIQRENHLDPVLRALYKSVLSPGPVYQLADHQDEVSSVAYSSSGKYLATGSWDHTIMIWDAETGEIHQILTGHQDKVTDIEFSPSDNSIFSASLDGTLKQWDISTGNETQTFSVIKKKMVSIAISPDGKYLAGGDENGAIYMYNVETGALPRTFMCHIKAVRALEFVMIEDALFIVSGSDDGAIILWNIWRFQEETLIEEPNPNTINTISVNPHAGLIAFGFSNGAINLWDLQAGNIYHQFGEMNSNPLVVKFCPDGSCLAAGFSDGTIRIWDLRTKQETIRFLNPKSVRDISYSPDGHYLFSSTQRLFQIDDGTLVNRLENDRNNENANQDVAFSLDGQYAVTCDDDNHIRIWDAHRWELINTFSTHDEQVLAITISPDNRSIFSGGTGGKLIRWDLTGLKRRQFNQGSSILSIAISPDNQIAASGGEDGSIKLWNLQTGKIEIFLKTYRFVSGLDFSPNGKMLLSGSMSIQRFNLWDLRANVLENSPANDYNISGNNLSPDEKMSLSKPTGYYEVNLWDVETGNLIRTFYGHKGGISDVKFSRDGKLAFSSSMDGSVIVWDVDSGKMIQRIFAHPQGVTNIALGFNDEILITGSTDRTVKLWDVNTGEELYQFSGHYDSISGIAISPDDKFFLSASADHGLFLWRIPSLADTLDWVANHRLLIELSCEERVNYNIQPFCKDEVSPAPRSFQPINDS